MRKFEKMIKEEYGHDEPKDVIQIAILNLQHDSVVVGSAFCDLPIGARLILLAEAINWAAKTVDYDYYRLKTLLVAEAAKQWGVRIWYNSNQGTWNLYHKEVGVASFHDPHDEILIKTNNIANWNFPWSGVRRQDLAFEMLTDEKLLQEMANITRPRRFPLSGSPTPSLP